MKFSIVKHKIVWFVISGSLCLASLILIFAGGLRWGIDFTGGTLMEISFENEVTPAQVDEVFVSSVGADKGEKITETDTGVFIRSRELSNDENKQFVSALQDKGYQFTVDRSQSIGPSVGGIFKQRAYEALAIASLAIVVFIAFSFRKVPSYISPWKFGLSAIIALVHDVLITTGVFALLGLVAGTEIDALFITALLTVMGFSVHDTIVVFDRLRENLKTEKSISKFPEVAESALWQTMHRSINTSLSTLFVLTALLIFGSPTLFYFLLALVVGISVGTYSSIFLATPILVAWQKKR